MSASNDIPDDILEAVKVLSTLREKTYLSREEKDNINRAKLRIAYWACRNESVVASRENLSYILGADALEIMGAYDKYIEKAAKDEAERVKSREERIKAAKNRGGGGSRFWGND